MRLELINYIPTKWYEKPKKKRNRTPNLFTKMQWINFFAPFAFFIVIIIIFAWAIIQNAT